MGIPLLHQNIPHEILGFIDLTAEVPDFVPLIAGNTLICLTKEVSAIARRHDDGRMEILLGLQQGQYLHLLCMAEGLVER